MLRRPLEAKGKGTDSLRATACTEAVFPALSNFGGLRIVMPFTSRCGECAATIHILSLKNSQRSWQARCVDTPFAFALNDRQNMVR